MVTFLNGEHKVLLYSHCLFNKEEKHTTNDSEKARKHNFLEKGK